MFVPIITLTLWCNLNTTDKVKEKEIIIEEDENFNKSHENFQMFQSKLREVTELFTSQIKDKKIRMKIVDCVFAEIKLTRVKTDIMFAYAISKKNNNYEKLEKYLEKLFLKCKQS